MHDQMTMLNGRLLMARLMAEKRSLQSRWKTPIEMARLNDLALEIAALKRRRAT